MEDAAQKTIFDNGLQDGLLQRVEELERETATLKAALLGIAYILRDKIIDQEDFKEAVR